MPKSPMGRRWLFWCVTFAVAGLFFAVRPREASGRRDALRNAAAPRGSVALSAQPAAATAISAAPVPDALFAWARPANVAALDAALPAPTREMHYVRVNRALFDGKRSPFWQPAGEGRVTVPLPGGGALAVVIEESEMLDARRFTSTGRIEGRPASRAVFAVNGGFLNASIEDPELGTFALRVADESVSQFYQVDPTRLAPCGGARRPVIDAQALAAAAERKARQLAAQDAAAAGEMPATAAAENAQRAEVHLMMAYTQAVRANLAGAARTAAIQNDFDAMTARVNSVLAASQVTARVKLVRIHETTYAVDNPTAGSLGGLQEGALTALYQPADGAMDDIHAARDQSGADVVCLALARADPASVGLAYVLESPAAGIDDPYTVIDPAFRQPATNPLFALAVVEYSTVTGTNVPAHELGHLFGCAHDREHSNNPGAYTYSYGYRFFGANGRQYRDIMSYQPGTELGYFSNPRVTVPAPVSAPIGIAAGLPGEADTARTIEQNAFELATFRLQTQAAPNPGLMVNVSTRAYVGEVGLGRALIGGFIIGGTQKKTMLLRAVGPSLKQVGVNDGLLADPRLELYSGSTKLVENNDWGAQANASAIFDAGRRVGAFDYVDFGTRDAALLVTLEPGAYTAIVSGADGGTGNGMVEAYDTERSSNKVINLSTRAYADRNGKEMIGGFVVEGAAGTTKRILIRARGPSLGRDFGIAGSMEDPFLQVHNALGELLLQNDDWAVSSSSTDGFRPRVTYYSEQQLSATGLAPVNRREPAVMLDLLPGAYTVIVKPFELRDPDPAEDQPAKPGIAAVDVYEINP